MIKSVEYKSLEGNYILVDLRSPCEYSEYTIPGAVNVPIFDDEERRIIGTVYTKESIDKAKELGVQYASKRLPELYSRLAAMKERHDKVILFCERGGMRSSSLCGLLNTIGMGVVKLKGGYKGYRAAVNEELPKLNAMVDYIVLHGLTGTGKTELLSLLSARGLEILDLEKYANHRGSLLGDVGLGESISQKQFEALVYEKLRHRNSGDIFVEGESSRIGNIIIPAFIMSRMKAGRHVLVEAGMDTRVRRIIKEYTTEAGSKTEIIKAMEKLGRYISGQRIQRYKQLVAEERYEEVVEELITKYYDPMYKNELKHIGFDCTVNTDDMEEAVQQIMGWHRKTAVELQRK